MNRQGLTLIELMLTIVIVTILAAAATPLYVRALDKAKWSEANAAAGTIRTAVLACSAEIGIDEAQALVDKKLSEQSVQETLGFRPFDLDGTFFGPGDYTIAAVNSKGLATITVTGGSKPESPSGSYQLEADGDWVKQ
ncbi:MAG: prepilin-type N-terminal cleavage/methylation domain-containing protein [Planctomycetes bacterium]|nr:prepilin-type N-terminal cleavage/methylation domain-containing protein [Planctomycetota bacterium]